jgi:hypothetical protein
LPSIFGRRRAKEGAGPATLAIDFSFIGAAMTHAAAVQDIAARPPVRGAPGQSHSQMSPRRSKASIAVSRCSAGGAGGERTAPSQFRKSELCGSIAAEADVV